MIAYYGTSCTSEPDVNWYWGQMNGLGRRIPGMSSTCRRRTVSRPVHVFTAWRLNMEEETLKAVYTFTPQCRVPTKNISLCHTILAMLKLERYTSRPGFRHVEPVERFGKKKRK